MSIHLPNRSLFRLQLRPHRLGKTGAAGGDIRIDEIKRLILGS
jgi:hypothetical protein